MANTHRAIIQTSVPPGIDLIAAGDEEQCHTMLGEWVHDHPLGQFQTAHVVAVVDTWVPTEQSRRLYEGIDKRLLDISEQLTITNAHIENLLHELAAAGDDGTYAEPLAELFTELEQRARTVKEIGD